MPRRRDEFDKNIKDLATEVCYTEGTQNESQAVATLPGSSEHHSRDRSARAMPEHHSNTDPVVDIWAKCYDDSWKGLLPDAAFAHPAKFSKSLIFNIIQHLLDEGFIKAGDTICDPFGGVALGGLPCALHGLAWVGVELEQNFVTLGQANIEAWTRRWGHLPQYVAPVMLQGDSRQLATVLSQHCEALVTSPPYAGSTHVNTNPDDMTAGKAVWANGTDSAARVKQDYAAYTAPGQLAALPPGTLDATLADAVVSSPPWTNQLVNHDTPEAYQALHEKIHRDGKGHGGKVGASVGQDYGEHPANLGTMPTTGGVAGVVEATVSSPPYMGRSQADGGKRGTTERASMIDLRNAYGDTPGQLSQLDTHTTFWEASKVILQQVHALLKPGGVAVWVVKAYVRDGQLVDFPGDWRRLAESCGFVTLHEHHALLVEEHGTQGLLFCTAGDIAQSMTEETAVLGEERSFIGKRITTQKKSFFRRLAERKGSPAINHETVYCMIKPLVPDQGDGFEACCASPPYNLPMSQDHNGSHGGQRGTTPSEAGAFVKYGNSAGQLEGMAMGSLEACLSSPPYVHSAHDSNDIDQDKLTGNTPGRHTQAKAEGYGATPGNLGTMPAGQPPSPEEVPHAPA